MVEWCRCDSQARGRLEARGRLGQTTVLAANFFDFKPDGSRGPSGFVPLMLRFCFSDLLLFSSFWRGLLLVASLGCCATPTRAQNAVAPPPSAPFPASLPGSPTSVEIDVLLLAIDELPVVAPAETEAAKQPVVQPGTVAPGGPVNALPQAPGVPPIAPAAAITPTNSLVVQPFWKALAQRAGRDEPFAPTPDFGGNRPTPEPPPVLRMPARRNEPPAPGGAVLVPLPAVPPAGQPAAGVVPPTPEVAPAGRSQLAALSIRSLLGDRGFGDVLSVAIDSPTVTRPLGEGRLTSRVVQRLQSALSSLSAVPNDKLALERGVQSAARIGQVTGFRAVVPCHVSRPRVRPEGGLSATFVLLLVDASRESGRAFVFDEQGADEQQLRAAGATTTAALLERNLRDWTPVSVVDTVALSVRHLEAAKAALGASDLATAQDELNQVLALEPTRSEAYVLLGDVLARTDPAASARAYRRAVEIDARDGLTWGKITQAYVNATPPDYAAALESGRKAIAAGADTVTLHIALASARFGRAELYRKADRLERAEDDEFHARQHLERALQLAPDDPAAIRLLARSLLAQNRTDDAVSTLDRLAPRFPRDLEIQALYANALARKTGREEDAFIAAARVWKLTGQSSVESDPLSYRTLAGGFDIRVFSIGRAAVQLTTGVANAAVAREAAFLQLSKFREEMDEAETAIKTLRPPASVPSTVAESRLFAADLTSQSLEALQTYLETGQEIYRSRGLTLYRQAVFSLNQARTGQ